MSLELTISHNDSKNRKIKNMSSFSLTSLFVSSGFSSIVFCVFNSSNRFLSSLSKRISTWFNIFFQVFMTVLSSNLSCIRFSFT